MTDYALFFKASELVAGRGYVALVRVRGRLLAVRTETDFELYGVNPGGGAVYAPTLPQAYAAFVEDLRLVLEDIALDEDEFDRFRREVEDCFSTTGPRTEKRWHKARERARRGEIDTDIGLRLERLNPPLGVEVHLLDVSKTEANQRPERPLTALAA